jgi:hypothetical protein
MIKEMSDEPVLLNIPFSTRITIEGKLACMSITVLIKFPLCSEFFAASWYLAFMGL